MKLRLWRPLPADELKKALRGAKDLVVLDRSVAIESMKSALESRKASPGSLAAAAQENGAWKQMKPYLEALTSNG